MPSFLLALKRCHENKGKMPVGPTASIGLQLTGSRKLALLQRESRDDSRREFAVIPF
jgi:hypothetical protein